jgi:hypothetical protein
MAQAYEGMLSKMQVAGVALYGDALRNASTMWQDCEREWGRGTGYRQRVAGHNNEWFADPSVLALESSLRESLVRGWTAVIERVGASFESNE